MRNNTIRVSSIAVLCILMVSTPGVSQEGLGGGEQGIHSEYDKFENTTSIVANIHELQDVSSNNRPFHLAMMYSCDGNNECKPDSVTVVLANLQKKELNDLGLIVLLDGETRLRLGELSGTSSVAFGNISLKNLQTIASAKKIEYQLGTLEDRLREDEAQVLQEFAERATRIK